jgi:hypothetical protein
MQRFQVRPQSLATAAGGFCSASGCWPRSPRVDMASGVLVAPLETMTDVVCCLPPPY